MSTWFELLLLLLPLLVPLLLTKYVLIRTHPHCSISFQSSPRKVGREVRKKGRKKESFGVLATLFLSFSFTLVPSDPPSSVNGPRWLLLNVSWRQETRKRKIFSIQGFSHPHPLGLSRWHAPLTLCHITYIWATCYLFTVLSIYLSLFLSMSHSLSHARKYPNVGLSLPLLLLASLLASEQDIHSPSTSSDVSLTSCCCSSRRKFLRARELLKRRTDGYLFALAAAATATLFTYLLQSGITMVRKLQAANCAKVDSS